MNEILYSAACADMNRFGNGVFIPRDGPVVFVPGAVGGDVCDVRITSEKDGFRMGELVRIISPSPERATVGCPVFSECGGCDFLHISRKYELELKRRSVEGAFKKQRLDYIKVGDVVACSDHGYRNKAVVRHDAENGCFGFYSERTHNVIRHEKCLLYPDFFADIFACSSAAFKGDSRVPAWFLRCNSMRTEAVLCAAVTRSGTLDKAFADGLRGRFPMLCGVCETVNNPHKPLSFAGKTRVLSGVGYVADSLCGVTYNISPASFYQVNHAVAEAVYSHVSASLEGCENILDLYSGIGTISLTLAKSNPRANVVGVEIVPQAVADAKAAAAANEISNVRFICADAEKYANDMQYMNKSGSGGSENNGGNGFGDSKPHAVGEPNGFTPPVKFDAVGEPDNFTSPSKYDAVIEPDNFTSPSKYDAVIEPINFTSPLKYDAVVIDPPRAGCGRTLPAAIAKTGAERVVYVSCNPDTLARDLRVFEGLGYRAAEATPFDMFPRTGHVETLVVLSR